MHKPEASIFLERFFDTFHPLLQNFFKLPSGKNFARNFAISHFDGDATAKCATVSKFVIHSFSPRFSKAIRRRISTPFRKLRFHSEIRRRFVVSFHHCFENFDFTSKFEGGSPSHFDTISTFIHSRDCFELRRRFAVSFCHFSKFSISLRNSKAVHHRISTLFRITSIVDIASNCDGDSPSIFTTISNLKNIRYCFEIRLRFDVAIRTYNEIDKYEVPTRWRRIKLIINPTNHTFTHIHTR